MNTLLKEKIAEIKDQIKETETQIEIYKNNVNVQKKLIKTLVSSKEDQVAQILNQIKHNESEIEINEKRHEDLTNESIGLVGESEDPSELEKHINSTVKAKTLFSQTVENNSSTIKFFDNNETCPSCAQSIPHEHKASIIASLNTDQVELENNIKIVDDAYSKLIERQKKQNEINKKLISINTQSSAICMSISNLIKQNKKLQEDIETAKLNTNNIDIEKQKLKDIANGAMQLINRKNELLNTKQIQDVALLLLKDTGVKTAIIREYLPVMNKLINGYLTAMDFYVHFELDESFNEVIKSRYRDEFTYASFSEGEKMRIDLAILFTWRHIAKMKNSVNTNLLLLDEIFDSSLDTAGTDYFLSIMNTLQDKTNVFVISHKGDQLFDKFHSVIRVEKKNDFSTIL